MRLSERTGCWWIVITSLMVASSGRAQAPALPDAPTTVAPPSSAMAVASSGSQCVSGVPPNIRVVRGLRGEIKVGESVRIEWVVEHPEGLPTTLRIPGVPATAIVDEELGTFQWTPGPTDVGDHPLRFIASDGARQTVLPLTIVVVRNRPPSLSIGQARLMAGRLGEIGIRPYDQDGDAVQVRFENLPAGASYDAQDKVLRWTPEEAAIGVHAVTAILDDGEATARVNIQVEVRTEHENPPRWTSFLRPGLGYTLHVPMDGDAYGALHGISMALVLATWAKGSNDRAPSHGRFYVSTDLLGSTRNGRPGAFVYGAGLSLSFERDVTRRFLIPSYGFDLGGIIHESAGHNFLVTPYLVLLAYSDEYVTVAARAGYRIVPARLDTLSGFNTALSVSLSGW